MSEPDEGMVKIETVNTLENDSPQYRLGDAVIYRHARGGERALAYVANSPQHFSGTFVYEYASKINRDDPDPQWAVLRDIVLRRSREREFEQPGADELVIHLRLGDTKGYKLTADVFVDYVVRLLDSLETRIHCVRIVTALHFGKLVLEDAHRADTMAGDISGDIIKVHQVMALFSARSIQASVYSHQNIDQDFSFLVHARYLLLGNGHFSLCAAMISGAQCFVPPWASIEPTHVEALRTTGRLRASDRCQP